MTTSQKRAFVPTGATLFFLIMASMMNCMGGAAVAPTLPLISETFPQTSETIISFIVTLPSLGVAASGFFIGAIADRFGKVKTLGVSTIVLMVAGTAGMYLPNVETILISRVFLGFGIAGVTLCSSALISEYYDGEKRNKVYGWQSFGAGLGVLVLETVGGYMALLGWRIPFLIYLVALIILIGAITSMREPSHETSVPAKHQDATEETEQISEDSSYARRRLVMVTIFCCAVAFLCQICFFAIPSKMPYLLDQMNASTAVSGWFLGFHGIALAACSLMSNKINVRFGRIATVVMGLSSAGIGMACLAFAAGPILVLIGAIFVGAASGIMLPVLVSWLGAVTTFKNSGKVMGIYTTLFNIGQFCSSLVTGLVLGYTASYQGMYFALFVLVIAIIILTLLMSRPLRGYAAQEREAMLRDAEA